MRKLIGISVVTLSLLGLVACGTGTDEVKVKGEMKTRMTDSELENHIEAKLNEDPQIKAADLRVSANAERNEATISGTVESQAVRARAIDLARSAHTGVSVTDNIEVRAREYARGEYTEELAREQRSKAAEWGDTIGNTLDDAWVHMKIVSKLIGNTATPERKINVDVLNNVVTLRGTVDTAEQKTEAERVARETDGVRSVNNRLKILGR